MFSIYDMYLLGSCGITLGAYFLIVWFDKDNNKKEIRNENETHL
jgi:hypothetical protein